MGTMKWKNARRAFTGGRYAASAQCTLPRGEVKESDDCGPGRAPGRPQAQPLLGSQVLGSRQMAKTASGPSGTTVLRPANARAQPGLNEPGDKRCDSVRVCPGPR